MRLSGRGFHRSGFRRGRFHSFNRSCFDGGYWSFYFFCLSLLRFLLRRSLCLLFIRLRFSGVPDGARVTVDLRTRRTEAVLRRTGRSTSGRVWFRLSDTESELLAGGGPIRLTVLVEADGAQATLDAGDIRPDTRTLVRRIAGRLRQGRA